MIDWKQIITLVIGGGLTIAGIVISQFFGLFSGAIERKHQTRLRRKQCLEKMVDLISECQPWLQKIKLYRTMDEIQREYPPLQRRQVVMLARLSFPSIVEIALAWSNCHVRYYDFAANCFDRARSSPLGEHIHFAIIQNAALKKHEDEPMLLRNMLDDAIAEEAKKYQDL